MVQRYNACYLKFDRIWSCRKYFRYTSSFDRSATSSSFSCMSNLVLDSPLCRATAPQLHPLLLLLPDGVRFSCCSPIALHFNCCSPIESTSAATRCLRLVQLQLLDCICFGCCPPIAFALLLLLDCVRL